jgi:hypothetical protein
LFIAELENVIKFFSVVRYDLSVTPGEEYWPRSMPFVIHKFLGFLGCAGWFSPIPTPRRSLSIQSQAQLLKEFPEDVQQAIMTGWNDPTMYRWALEKFFEVHGCTLSPWPLELTTSFDALFADPTVSQQT